MNTTLVSSTPAHAAAVFGFALAPVIGLYLSHHGDMPLILTVGLLWIGVFFLWRKMLPKPPAAPKHVPIHLPPTLTLGNGIDCIHCDDKGIRLGPNTLLAAAPFEFKEDVHQFKQNRFEMFVAWSEVDFCLDVAPKETSIQIVYKENKYKAWIMFQPPRISQEQRTLLKAFIQQGGQNPLN